MRCVKHQSLFRITALTFWTSGFVHLMMVSKQQILKNPSGSWQTTFCKLLSVSSPHFTTDYFLLAWSILKCDQSSEFWNTTTSINYSLYLYHANSFSRDCTSLIEYMIFSSSLSYFWNQYKLPYISHRKERGVMRSKLCQTNKSTVFSMRPFELHPKLQNTLAHRWIDLFISVRQRKAQYNIPKQNLIFNQTELCIHQLS